MRESNSDFARMISDAYSANSVHRYPSHTEALNEWREDTTFYGDFVVALLFSVRDGDTKALDDTWSRAFNEWKGNIKYMVELTIVMNHLCWETYYTAKGNEKIVYLNENPYLKVSKWFEDKYYLSKAYIFDSRSGFSSEDRNIAFDILD